MENSKIIKYKYQDYKLIDLLKFICAFLVIGIHTRPFQASSGLLDRIFYYDISNYAVPFFYACTGYLLVVKRPEEDLHPKLMHQCKKVLKIYLLWSSIYLPLTIYGWIVEGELKLVYLLRCLRNFIFVGENFYSWTLWYLNGLIFALFIINFLSRKFEFKQIVYLGLILYFIGIGMTMCNAHLEKLPSVLANPIDLYFSLFVTTRNGFFQSLVFISIGMLIGKIDCDNKLKISTRNELLIGFIYLVKVGFSLVRGGQYFSQILDLFVFWFVFKLIIYGCHKINLKGTMYKRLRSMSETIYFVHMYFVAFCSLIIFNGNYHNFTSFFICSICSLLISEIYWHISRRKMKIVN